MNSPPTEQLLSLSEAAKLPWLPRRRHGSRLHVATLHRWATTGVRGIRLTTSRVGGQPVVTESALRQFFDRLAESDPTPPSAHSYICPKPVNDKRATAVQRELDRLGI